MFVSRIIVAVAFTIAIITSPATADKDDAGITVDTDSNPFIGMLKNLNTTGKITKDDTFAIAGSPAGKLEVFATGHDHTVVMLEGANPLALVFSAPLKWDEFLHSMIQSTVRNDNPVSKILHTTPLVSLEDVLPKHAILMVNNSATGSVVNLTTYTLNVTQLLSIDFSNNEHVSSTNIFGEDSNAACDISFAVDVLNVTTTIGDELTFPSESTTVSFSPSSTAFKQGTFILDLIDINNVDTDSGLKEITIAQQAKSDRISETVTKLARFTRGEPISDKVQAQGLLIASIWVFFGLAVTIIPVFGLAIAPVFYGLAVVFLFIPPGLI